MHKTGVHHRRHKHHHRHHVSAAHIGSKTVPQLRRLARSLHVKQVTSQGHTRNRSQLLRAIAVAKHGGHRVGGAHRRKRRVHKKGGAHHHRHHGGAHHHRHHGGAHHHRRHGGAHHHRRHHAEGGATRKRRVHRRRVHRK
jgi:hypothetical protein